MGKKRKVTTQLHWSGFETIVEFREMRQRTSWWPERDPWRDPQLQSRRVSLWGRKRLKTHSARRHKPPGRLNTKPFCQARTKRVTKVPVGLGESGIRIVTSHYTGHWRLSHWQTTLACGLSITRICRVCDLKYETAATWPSTGMPWQGGSSYLE